MFGLPIIEVAIGLSFVYLLLALICSTVNETIAGITGRRGALLEKGINSLLGENSELKKSVLAHPLIASLASKAGAKPSYIPAARFALALMDVVTGDGKAANDGGALRAAAGVKAIGAQDFLKSLTTVLVDGRQTLATDQQKIEAWYNDCMDRVSGWYKRHTLIWIWVLAASVTLALDANTIQMFQVLWTNQGVRSAVVESARARAQAARPEELTPLVEYTEQNQPKRAAAVNVQSNSVLTDKERGELEQLTSWKKDIDEWKAAKGWPFVGSLLLHILGWLFTAAAVSLGAPFWFDTLNKFMNIRSSGRSPSESPLKAAAAKAAA